MARTGSKLEWNWAVSAFFIYRGLLVAWQVCRVRRRNEDTPSSFPCPSHHQPLSHHTGDETVAARIRLGRAVRAHTVHPEIGCPEELQIDSFIGLSLPLCADIVRGDGFLNSLHVVLGAAWVRVDLHRNRVVVAAKTVSSFNALIRFSSFRKSF